jgi:chorismate mutase
MENRHFDQPGLNSFWEQADIDESGEHPIERELCDHLDALARYRRLIHDAIANSRDDALNILLDQHEREERVVRRLHGAWQKLRQQEREREPGENPSADERGLTGPEMGPVEADENPPEPA